MNPQHTLMFSVDCYDIEYIHIYRKWRTTNTYQYLATFFIDELLKVFPPHIHERIFSDENRPAVYVLSETFEPCNKDGKRL